MALIDWIVLAVTMVGTIAYGLWHTRHQHGIKDYIKGGGDTPWWTIGLSVMATQASAITFLSTPGQAYNDGMGFVQFYFGVPVAMVIICLIFIPRYHRMKVYTAYEYLERRFDKKTRTLTAILFLIQRGLAAGITIFAPAIILSAVLGWSLSSLIFLIGLSVIVYTVTGGTKAVSVTQKQQMIVIMLGMVVTFGIVIAKLPTGIGFVEALQIAGQSGKMQVLDFSFDLNNRYTFWTGLIGGSFLALSYFGTDQSQVQRYLSGGSVRDMRLGLVFNGLLKVPMQFFILLVGVMVFVFYQFNETPLHFNPAATAAVYDSDQLDAYRQAESDLYQIQAQKRDLLLAARSNTLDVDRLAMLEADEIAVRQHGKTLIAAAAQDIETNDKDYVFLHFVLSQLPRGLIGLLLAAILFAAMSSTASELNALGTISAIDLYQRNVPDRSEAHYVRISRGMTLLWGVLAIAFAHFASLAENLIQFVNIIGSIFYGNVLGIFLLAFFVSWVRGRSVFIAAIITQLIVIGIYYVDVLPYLWLNFVGCAIVMVLAMMIERGR